MKIGFIGNGWRTQGYWRVVRQVPEKFTISGVLFRNAEKAAEFEKTGPGLAYTDIDEFLKQGHDMVFLLLPWSVLPPYIKKALAAGFPLLVETPPSGKLEGLRELWELNQKYHARIQIAEQYFLQPYHRAVRALSDRGVFGEVSNLRISMGSILLGMDDMIHGGEEIYPLKDALEDSYLWLMMDEAIRTGKPVRTEPQAWNE